MGWIWILFILISVISNIFEKVAKTQQTQRIPRPGRTGEGEKGSKNPSAPRPVAFPPFFLEEEEDYNKGIIPEVTKSIEPEISRVEEKTTSPGPLDTKGKGKIPFEEEFSEETFDDDILSMESMDEDFGQEKDFVEKDESGEKIETKDFYSAFLLAQIIARPDFKTIPWKRRL